MSDVSVDCAEVCTGGSEGVEFVGVGGVGSVRFR